MAMEEPLRPLPCWPAFQMNLTLFSLSYFCDAITDFFSSTLEHGSCTAQKSWLHWAGSKSHTDSITVLFISLLPCCVLALDLTDCEDSELLGSQGKLSTEQGCMGTYAVEGIQKTALWYRCLLSTDPEHCLWWLWKNEEGVWKDDSTGEKGRVPSRGLWCLNCFSESGASKQLWGSGLT